MRSFEPVKVAVVGCGAITRAAHLPAVVRSSKFHLGVLVDRSREVAEHLAHAYGLQCEISVDLAPVLDRVEAVIIATPNHTHCSLAELALRQHKPVFIEKPITTTHRDAVKLSDLAQQADTFIAVGYVKRQYPSVRLLKNLLGRDYLGNIRSFRYEFGTAGGWSPISGYSIDRERAGGGVLMTAGSHFIDAMLYWFGEPSSIRYEDDSYGGVEANCRAQLMFPGPKGGFHGEILLSKTATLRNCFILETETYRLLLREAQSESLTLYPREQPDLKLEISTREAAPATDSLHYFQRQLEEFARRVRDPEATVTVDGRSAATSVRLIERMYQQRLQMPEPWLVYRTLSTTDVSA